MSCFHPLYVTFCNGTFGRFGGRLTQSVLDAYKDSDVEVVPVPCGKCIGCRLDRAQAWSDRMLLEYNASDRGYPVRSALFVTLTYDDLHKPCVTCSDDVSRGTLDYSDVQLFLKRLRKALPHRVRFFCAGEYGDTTFRPHYHLILFGCTMDDFPDSVVYSSDPKLGQFLFTSCKFDNLWQKGSVKFCPATYGTMAYVAQYVLKKQYLSDNLTDFYRGRKPPFITMSRCPGIGSGLFDLDDNDLLVPSVSVNDGDDVHVVKIPRVYLEKLSLTNPDLYDIIKENRRALAHASDLLVKAQLDCNYFDYLKSCESSLVRRRKNKSNRDKI